MEKYHRNTIEYWKQNAEEDYLTTPISVLKYITALEEQVEQLRKHAVCGRSEQFCSCSFVMIMRDSETDIAYCSECKKEVNEQNCH